MIQDPHPTVEWVRIDASGRESPRRGARWSDAPRVPKAISAWVLTDDPLDPVALVVTVTVRHRAEGGMGRWFDPGESYQDEHTTRLASRGAIDRPGWLTSVERRILTPAGGRTPPWRRWLGPIEPLPEDLYNGLSGMGG